MTTPTPTPRPLPKAAEQIERASRIIGLLVKLHTQDLLFRDVLAYALETLLRGTAMIQEQSKSQRTAAFAGWWDAEPLADRSKIEALRHAELKRGEIHSAPQWSTVVNADPADFPGRRIAPGDSVTSITWFWEDGPFAGDQVMATLQTYLVELRLAHAEAERLLTR